MCLLQRGHGRIMEQRRERTRKRYEYSLLFPTLFRFQFAQHESFTGWNQQVVWYFKWLSLTRPRRCEATLRSAISWHNDAGDNSRIPNVSNSCPARDPNKARTRPNGILEQHHSGRPLPRGARSTRSQLGMNTAWLRGRSSCQITPS